MTDHIAEIVKSADAQNIDPFGWVRDFCESKGDRPRHIEIRRLIDRARERIAAQEAEKEAE